MGNGNGNAVKWTGIGVAIVLAIIGAVAIVPTRAEMKEEIRESQESIQIQLQDIKEMVGEIRQTQLDILMGDGGDRTRGEGN